MIVKQVVSLFRDSPITVKKFHGFMELERKRVVIQVRYVCSLSDFISNPHISKYEVFILTNDKCICICICFLSYIRPPTLSSALDP
jgi:hypothetical protein